MGVHGINKKKFDGGDELIRKAFKIYSDKDLESSMEDFGFEYRDDKVFEDKIYKVIKKTSDKKSTFKSAYYMYCCYMYGSGFWMYYRIQIYEKQKAGGADKCIGECV